MTGTPASAARVLLAVDAGSPDVAAAEHLVHLLDDVLPAGDPSYVASTHVVAGHVVVVASWAGRYADRVPAALGCPDPALVVRAGASTTSSGPADAVAGATVAADEHAARRAGRLTRFRGRSGIERRLTVREVLDTSAVEAVEALAGTVVGPDDEVDLTDWARPTWRAGRTVLLVQPARGGLVPFEARQQIACCTDH